MKDDLKGTYEQSIKNAKSRFPTIDEARLKSFVQAQPDIVGEVQLSPLVYPRSGAGSSNGIAFFTAELDRGRGLRRYDLVLRYSPGEIRLLKQKSFADEFLTVKAVSATGLSVPNVLWLDADGRQVGCPSYVMERVVGDAPSGAMYSAGAIAEATPAGRKAMMLEAAGFHGSLRKAAIGSQQVPHLLQRGSGATAIERELSWWLKEGQLARPEDDERLCHLETIYRWMIEHQPKAYEPRLVHGDAQIANMMFRDGHIAAVLDWELSYLGHNEADLALVVFITESLKVLDRPIDGTPTEAEYIARFEQESGSKVQHWEYFKLFNIYKCCMVNLLAMDFMPSFDTVWDYYAAHLQVLWDDARAAA
ncbi:MAG: hypothetical protein JWQ90_4748 [Hydrocarboniphaga sp.]|uniref:phosphotransferase family protein n=1 Tax=Hydrocarboniphaga sp. TaxID=2033016 RepID=UPI0026362480|nr:phosphotransferase family protein [Hydrocarboniphaga sp.]MDB5972298.1 hypothetical protein [Hydrocarboniphaga sp.]